MRVNCKEQRLHASVRAADLSGVRFHASANKRRLTEMAGAKLPSVEKRLSQIGWQEVKVVGVGGLDLQPC